MNGSEAVGTLSSGRYMGRVDEKLSLRSLHYLLNTSTKCLPCSAILLRSPPIHHHINFTHEPCCSSMVDAERSLTLMAQVPVPIPPSNHVTPRPPSNIDSQTINAAATTTAPARSTTSPTNPLALPSLGLADAAELAAVGEDAPLEPFADAAAATFPNTPPAMCAGVPESLTLLAAA